MTLRTLAAGLTLALGSSATVAGDFMSGEDLKKALCGKTFMGENIDLGLQFKVYYPEKCDEVIHHYLNGSKAGQRVTWPLRIIPNGDHCVTNDGKEKCARFVSPKGGVLHAMRDGKVIYTRTNAVDGNQLDK